VKPNGGKRARLLALGQRGLRRVGRAAWFAFERADELGGEARDFLLAHSDSPLIKRLSDRLARVRGKGDSLFEEEAEAARRHEASLKASARADASPPPTAEALARAAQEQKSRFGNPEVAAQIYGRESCPFTGRALRLLMDHKVDYDFIDLDESENAPLEEPLAAHTGQRTVPQIFIRGTFVGGFNALDEIVRLGELPAYLDPRAEVPHGTEIMARPTSNEVPPALKS